MISKVNLMIHDGVLHVLCSYAQLCVKGTVTRILAKFSHKIMNT